MDTRPVVDITIHSQPQYGQLFGLVESEVRDTIFHIHINLWPVLTTFELLILTGCMSDLVARGCGFRLFTNDKVSKQLNRLGHKAFVETQSDQLIDIDEQTAIIARISKERMLSHIIDIRSFVRKICPDKDSEMLEHCLSELLNNVFDHSGSENGAFLICRYIPDDRLISVGVADLGIGIPESVGRFIKHSKGLDLSDIACLKWAIKENNTTLSIPRNMGKGLNNVNSFVRSVRSKWLLVSGTAQLISMPLANSYAQNPIQPFLGTTVVVNIKVDNLSQSVSDESEGW